MGYALAMKDILILLRLCKNTLIPQLVEIGVIIPLHYDNNEVPMSVLTKDFLTTYKLGWKTSYHRKHL